MRWFAARCDMIILCFDAHKLDISDEFADTIGALKGNEEKIRVVLNKCDSITHQELMRVYVFRLFILISQSYGALMWSLGKVLITPEVTRVYISSFWDQPYKNRTLETLFNKERADLVTVLTMKSFIR